MSYDLEMQISALKQKVELLTTSRDDLIASLHFCHTPKGDWENNFIWCKQRIKTINKEIAKAIKQAIGEQL